MTHRLPGPAGTGVPRGGRGTEGRHRSGNPDQAGAAASSHFNFHQKVPDPSARAGMFPALRVMGEPCVSRVGAGSCEVSPLWRAGDATNPPSGWGCGVWGYGMCLHPSCCTIRVELGVQPPRHCRRDECWPCPHPFFLALAGGCGELRSCEMCTASSHPHNGTDCVWVGCGTPEEPGEGSAGWAQRGAPISPPQPLSLGRGCAQEVSALSTLGWPVPATFMARAHLSCSPSPSLGPHPQTLRWMPTPQ